MIRHLLGSVVGNIADGDGTALFALGLNIIALLGLG